MNKTNVLILYIRISVEDDDNHENGKDESDSVTNQRDLLLDFVKSHDEFSNFEIVEMCDDGYSGTNLERPAVKNLLEKAKKNEVDCIIVKDFSRFGRDYLTVSDYVDQIFPFLGVRFISVNDNYDSEKSYGTTGGVEIAFQNVINSYYSQDISQKVKSGKQTKALNGDFLSAFAPIGYKKDKQNKNRLVIDEKGAEIVKRIFDMAIMGMTTMQIARIFNAEKVPTPSQLQNEKGFHHLWWDCVGMEKYWDYCTIRLILRDERYLGKTVYGKHYRPVVGNYRTKKNTKADWIVVCDKHEPIVSTAEFEAAQDKLGEYQEQVAKQQEIHIFTGKMRCGGCHRALERRANPTPRFVCSTKYMVEDNECLDGHIKENEVADMILRTIKAYSKAFLKKKVLAKQAKQADGLSLLKKQIAVYQAVCKKFKVQRAELYDLKADGIISKGQFLQKQNILSKQQEDMEQQIDMLTAQIAEQERSLSTEKLKECELRHYLKADALTRKMVVAFVDCIYVYSDKSIYVKWRFDGKGQQYERNE